jgi:transcription initiation factor TFIIIB Brf1 subunit/transcription initiation factor TFIIB
MAVGEEVVQNRCIKDEHNTFEDYITGQIICRNCGLVLQTHLISQDGQHFPIGNRNIYENKIHYARKNIALTYEMHRILKLNHLISWDEKKLNIGITEISRLTANYGASNVIKVRTIYLFRKAIKLRSFRIHYVLLIAKICFYYSARENEFPLMIQDLLKETDFNINLAHRYYYLLMKELNLSAPILKPYTLIPSICTTLNLPAEVKNMAITISKFFQDHSNNSGLDSKGIAGGAICFACKLCKIPRSQKKIAKSSHIAEMTVHLRYKEIEKIFQKHNKSLEELLLDG